ncbi:MAG TPA: Stp1/IreP family PP2C-type Ser/Thr phosphatase [Solirubrobacterales bacterium]
MLRVAEQYAESDTGRQRSANEDSYFARAPVFVVADGMGGAQAGEVASQVAAEAFEPGNASGESPEAYLRGVAEGANARIHELSQQDSSRSGMGTTLTAVLVSDDEISIAHVGDSRAYLWRDGELKRLTSDHSLVEELRRQGRLTESQAAEHPQRSIITRALGPEPTVNVDTMSYPARPGDAFLLCSDGLTTMLPDERIAKILAQSPDLRSAGKALIREANAAGGRDNITAVAFRLEEAGAGAPEEGATLIGPSAEEQGLTAEAVREGAHRGGAAAPTRERPSGSSGIPKRRWPARLAKTLIALAVVAALVVGGIWGARQIYFLGTDEGGRIALYRGLPYDLPAGIELYSEVYSSPTQAASLPEDRQDEVTDHELRGRDDAESLITDLEETAAESEPASTSSSSNNDAGGNASPAGGGSEGPADGPSRPDQREDPSRQDPQGG